jgi:hypothetical protein
MGLQRPVQPLFDQRAQRDATPLGEAPRPGEEVVVDVDSGFHMGDRKLLCGRMGVKP